MKNRLMAAMKVTLSLILCLVMVFTALPGTKADAAAKMTNKKAQKILKKKIKNKVCRYAFVDVDKDQIDELIVIDYSGEFVDGDDTQKNITVYKISGKKAKTYLSCSFDGDYFRPTVTFNLYYADGNSYIKVNYEHEGFAHYYLFMLGSKQYKIVAGYDDYIAENEQSYYLRTGDCSEEEYNAFVKDIFKGELKYKLKSPSTEIVNEYLNKKLYAEFERLCKIEYFDADTVSTVFDDQDGDGIDELIVRQGPLNGVIIYANVPLGKKDTEYSVGYTEYTIKNGQIIFDTP